jgi:flagellar biosynthesis/type III secretory pathway protein FliH
MAGVINLESFDVDEITDLGPHQDYDDGYAAGFAAATDAANLAADNLSHDLVQALSDMTFTYREAQQDVMESLRSLIEALVETILPTCASLGVAGQIADIVMARHMENQTETIMVHVHPDQQHAVQDATADIAPRVTILVDPTLSPHAAWIGQAGMNSFFDIDRCLADIRQILGSLYQDTQRNNANG